MERLSLKNIKFSEALSEETNAFVADVYLDGRKFGYAKNQGHGGSTYINAYEGKKALLEEAEEYAKNLPPQIVNFGGEKTELKMSLDFAIDLLLDKWLKQKDFKKGIVFKNAKGVTYVLKFSKAISTVLKSPNGQKAIQKEVDKIKAEGGTVLNDNLTGIKL